MNGSDIGISRFDVLKAVETVAGSDAVAALKNKWGGTEINIPARARERHWLTALIGLEQAQRVVDILDARDADGPIGFQVYISVSDGGILAKARAKCDAMLAEGKSVIEIREETGLSERSVYHRQRDYRAAIQPPPKLITHTISGESRSPRDIYAGIYIDPENIIDPKGVPLETLQALPADKFYARISADQISSNFRSRSLIKISEVDIAIFNFELKEAACVLGFTVSHVSKRAKLLVKLGFSIEFKLNRRRKRAS